jgi:hypothetical protein
MKAMGLAVAQMDGWRTSFDVADQSVCATHSANGATARPQVGTDSDSRIANGAIKRQLPSRCSKSHCRASGSRVIQSRTKASTLGRTGSMRSQAKLSQF